MMYERYLVDERYTYATNTVTGTTRAKKPCLEWHLTLSQFYKAILDMQRISFHLNWREIRGRIYRAKKQV